VQHKRWQGGGGAWSPMCSPQPAASPAFAALPPFVLHPAPGTAPVPAATPPLLTPCASPALAGHSFPAVELQLAAEVAEFSLDAEEAVKVDDEGDDDPAT
jgi:hypothetical protein